MGGRKIIFGWSVEGWGTTVDRDMHAVFPPGHDVEVRGKKEDMTSLVTAQVLQWRWLLREGVCMIRFRVGLSYGHRDKKRKIATSI